MTREETVKLFLMVKGNYPIYYRDIDVLSGKIVVNTWFKSFEDLPANVVFMVAQKHILNHDFPPTISQLREECVKLMEPQKLMSSEEAWEQVILAVKKFGYYRQSEAFETFSEPIKRAVKAIGWQNICMSENIGIERANFFKMFDSLEKGNRENYKMPLNFVEKLQHLTQQKMVHKAIGGNDE